MGCVYSRCMATHSVTFTGYRCVARFHVVRYTDLRIYVQVGNYAPSAIEIKHRKVSIM